MFAYMHVLDSKMRGMEEQSSLFLARFWPSLQQCSMEIGSPPVDKEKQHKVCFCKGIRFSSQRGHLKGFTPFKRMHVSQRILINGLFICSARGAGRLFSSTSKHTKVVYFHDLLILVSSDHGKKEKQNCKQSGKLNHLERMFLPEIKI